MRTSWSQIISHVLYVFVRRDAMTTFAAHNGGVFLCGDSSFSTTQTLDNSSHSQSHIYTNEREDSQMPLSMLKHTHTALGTI